MPLLDHFHPPLETQRHWESFHGRWAALIAETLDQGLLPAGYFAEIQVHVGSIQVDVAAFQGGSPLRPSPRNGEGTDPGGGTATLIAPAWAPPVPDLTMPALVPDEIEVQVFSESARDLVAAIELVSPGNKDRPEARRAFAAKCDVYLQRRVGLILVDVVTSRRANLHDELVRLRGHDEAFLFPDPPAIYAAAYRPVDRKPAPQVDAWLARLAVGGTLPTLPLVLREDVCLPIDFEATYMEVRRRSRMG